MFKILDHYGKVIGTTEAIQYYVKNKNNLYVPCKPHEADVIKYKNKFYALHGKHNKQLQEVFIKNIDTGAEFDSLSQTSIKLEQQLAETDEAAIELYEANLTLEEHNAEQDEAIIEIYELMEGLN